MLIAPLDWGLGHATRCIPITKSLINNGFNVLIAASGAQQKLLQKEFPAIEIIHIDGYNIQYATSKKWLPFKILWQLPKIFKAIRAEHRWLNRLMHERKIDYIISDNRYGLWNKKIISVFITHQLRIKAPFTWLEALMQKINYHHINRFNVCWVPDAPPAQMPIGGDLSHPLQKPAITVSYIGLLSRFSLPTATTKEFTYDFCILLSGPEPQRTLLEQKLLSQIKDTRYSVVLIQGKPSLSPAEALNESVRIISHLPGESLQKILQQSEFIISRSGYTTVMEVIALQKKAIFIPTPRQTEQEFLAKELMDKQLCYSVSQERFSWDEVVVAAKNFSYQTIVPAVFSGDSIVSLLKDAASAFHSS
ncbi:MAG: glycosyl transferase family 28 [Bacteroidota bacterium]|nr:glycosyl transferase family 28 [Bacteroidota bacterium]